MSSTSTTSSSPSDHNNNKHPVPDDPTRWQSTRTQRAWLTGACIMIVLSLLKSILAIVNDSSNWFHILLASITAYIFADFGTGVYHWAIDNYGSESTRVFGPQIEGFQNHHKFPTSITKLQLANNLDRVSLVVALAMIPVNLARNHAVVHAFFGVFGGCVLFSQQFHAWAHTARNKLPPVVVALQDAGLLLSRQQHAKHHCPPYDNNYCIVSGVWNKFLDRNKFFEALEKIVYVKFRVPPRSWKKD